MFLKLPSGDHPRSDGRRRVVIEAGAGRNCDARQQSTHRHHERDHPPPQRLSIDSTAYSRRSSRRRGRGGRSQPAASFQVLPPTTMRVGGRAIVLQYRCLLHASVVAIYTFLGSARRMCGGSVLAITWTRAVISCRVNCCRRPVSKKNLVLTSQLTAVVCGRRRPRHLRILFLQHRHWRLADADVPAGSNVVDFRCPMCTSAEL